MRILIADDHAIVRRGLEQLLQEAFADIHVGHAGDGDQALQMVMAEDWSLVLLDISMPGKNGIELLKQIKNRHPELPVLMLSMHPEDQYALRSLRAGASGYMNKEAAPDQLLEAIRRVVAGGRYISAAVADRLASELHKPSNRPPHETLSDREFQILCYIASGKSVTDIAGILPLSVKTVSTYRSRMMKKMGLRHNAELTHYAITHGLIS